MVRQAEGQGQGKRLGVGGATEQITLALPHLNYPEHWLVGVSQGQAPGHGKPPERD